MPNICNVKIVMRKMGGGEFSFFCQKKLCTVGRKGLRIPGTSLMRVSMLNVCACKGASRRLVNRTVGCANK